MHDPTTTKQTEKNPHSSGSPLRTAPPLRSGDETDEAMAQEPELNPDEGTLIDILTQQGDNQTQKDLSNQCKDTPPTLHVDEERA